VWLAWFAWSVSAVRVAERWLLVKAHLVLDSTSVLCSCCLTPNILPVSHTYVSSHLAQGTLYTHSVMSSLYFVLWVHQQILQCLPRFHGHRYIMFLPNSHYGFRNFLYWSFLFLITGSIAQSATCQYLIYSESDFEVFRPAEAICCTDWGEIWHGGRYPPPCQISPQSVQRQGCRTQKNWNFYSDLTKMWNINTLQVRIPCAIFTKFAEFVPHFRMR